jgi:hypothetical protein
MPRSITLLETDKKTGSWIGDINGINQITLDTAFEEDSQSYNLETTKVGRLFKITFSYTDGYEKTHSNQTIVHEPTSKMAIVIGGNSIESNLTTTIINTFTVKSSVFSNIFSTLYTQSNIDSMYSLLTFVMESFLSVYNIRFYTKDRTVSIFYCYEHKVAGVAPIKFAKIGGVNVEKIRSIAGRTQISGTADVVYA